MNTKPILSVLLAIAFLVVGCKPENFTGKAASDTPKPQQTLRLSEPVKVTLADPTINLARTGHRTLVGNILVAATTISDTIHWFSINLENGQVQGPQHLLQMNSLPATTMRYIPHSTSYYDDKTRHQVGELFVTDLQRGKEITIADNLPSFAEVSGNTVVWQGQSGGGWGIYGYDISASRLITIAGGPGSRTVPHVSGDWAIYLDMGKEAMLHAYNISTQENLTLGPTPYPRGRAGKYHLISDGKVVWADAETYDLHVLDLDTRASEVITDPVTTCKPVYELGSLVRHTLIYLGCEGWALYDLDSKASIVIPVLPAEIQARMTQTPNEDAIYSIAWIVMSDTRLVWTVTDGLGHAWLYTSQIER